MAAPIAAAPLGLQVPETFRTSYTNFNSYPGNLVQRTAFPAALTAHATRLGQFASRLFQTGQSYVFFREFTGIGIDSGLQKKEVKNEAELKEWLGDLSSATPVGGLVTKKDPKCRFIFLTAESSRTPLKTTRTMLTRILTYHQVMAGYLDFLFVFGSQNDARDLRFSGFREQLSLRKLAAPNPYEIRTLGRSGRQFQLSYNLKTVALKSPENTALADKEWSIRQAAFHHQFDIEEGTTLWIVTQGHLSIKERVQEMTAIHGRPEDRRFGNKLECFRTSLTTHLLYCQWSTEEWRWYIQWLEEVIEKETELAVYGTRDAKGEFIYTPKHIQSVQQREDEVNQAIMILEANTDVLTSLRDFYKRFVGNKDFDLKQDCEEDILEFAIQIDDMIYDSNMQISRAKVQVKITADRKNLILQHLQSQATTNMVELTNLTIKIGTMSQREAIAMRIITVVTLIYLPATFVSTFFSTDIVKYQNQNGGSGNSSDSGTGNVGQYMGSFSNVALDRWLEVTIPLTVITIAVSILAYRHYGKRADKEFGDAQLPLYEDDPKNGLGG